jgi:hypothetical protein
METKRKTLTLAKVDEVKKQIQEQAKMYLNSPERVVEALVFVRMLEEVGDEIKEFAKKRGAQMMSDANVTEVELDGWKIQQVQPTITKKYSVTSVIEGLGMERAIAFLEIRGGALEKYAMKAVKNGAMTYGEMEICQQAMKSAPKKGFIKLTKIKDKAE